MMNRSAERHDPCGTPMSMSMVPERMLLMMKCVVLSFLERCYESD